MKLYKQIIFILIVFFKTETLFSENNLFNVNNIELEKKEKISNIILANKAIKKGFNQLINKILLKQDSDKLSDIDFSSIKKLVKYYQVTDIADDQSKKNLVNFSVTFDKEKIHNLFYNRGILYSEILDKEFYILPIFIKKNGIFIFNNNLFYERWNKIDENNLIEFILPLENIEIIKNISSSKNNLIGLDVSSLFKEYSDKNLALVLIEQEKLNLKKVYIKAKIQGKNITKSVNFKKQNLSTDEFNEKIISETKKELINLVKSRNLIDIRTPSFLNVKFILNKKSSLNELNLRIKKIDSIENIYVQEFNKDYINIRIKYLGKLDKIIDQLKKENINLKFTNERWVIKTL